MTVIALPMIGAMNLRKRKIKMARGKYSPYNSKGPFVFHEWKTGWLGSVEVDAAGFDSYGYDVNGKDTAGNTEDDYLLMDDDLFDTHFMCALHNTVYKPPTQIPDGHVVVSLEFLKSIELAAESGVWTSSHPSALTFLTEIREMVKEEIKKHE